MGDGGLIGARVFPCLGVGVMCIWIHSHCYLSEYGRIGEKVSFEMSFERVKRERGIHHLQ